MAENENVLVPLRIKDLPVSTQLSNDDLIPIDSTTSGVRAVSPDVITADVESTISTVQSQVTTLSNTVGATQNRVTTLEGKVTTLEGNVQDLDDDVESQGTQISTLNIQVTNLETFADKLSEDIAPTHSTSASYVIGDLRTKQGVLYRCIAPTSGEWDSTKWERVDVAELLDESGKIDDVTVNGESVVTNKVAEIDLTEIEDGLEEVSDKADNAMILASLPSGAISTITDGSDLPLNSLKISIEAVQSGSGTASPENIRPISGWTGANVVQSGKNLFKIEDVKQISIGASNRNGVFFYKVGTYTVSSQRAGGYMYCRVFNADGTIKTTYNVVSSSTVTNATFSTSNGEYFAVYNALEETVTTSKDRFTNWQCQVEVGSQATDYEPYNSQTHTITWEDSAGTVYGGQLDVVSGVLEVTHGGIDMGSLTWSYYTQGTYPLFQARLNGAIYKSTGAINTMCSIYNAIGNQSRADFRSRNYNNCLCLTNTSGYIEVMVQDTRYTDATAFKEAITGQKLVYELSTPQTYQLSPTLIRSLIGSNNFFADCGDVLEGSYFRNATLCINDILARLDALENA